MAAKFKIKGNLSKVLKQMEKDINSKLKVPACPASALKGKGVGETLRKCLVLTLRHLQKEIKWSG